MKYLLWLIPLFLISCQSTMSSHPPRGLLGGLASSVTDNIATADAGWGAFVFVGALLALAGGVVLWLFRSPGPGLGMIVTGLAIGGIAMFLEELFNQVGLFLLIGAGVFIVWWLADENRRYRLRKRAGQLLGQGKVEEAIILEREANPCLDSACRKEERRLAKQNGKDGKL